MADMSQGEKWNPHDIGGVKASEDPNDNEVLIVAGRPHARAGGLFNDDNEDMDDSESDSDE